MAKAPGTMTKRSKGWRVVIRINGERHQFGRLECALKETRDTVESLTLGGAHQNHRSPQALREGFNIHVPATMAELIGHVEDNQDGLLQSQHGSGQDQVPPQVG